MATTSSSSSSSPAFGQPVPDRPSSRWAPWVVLLIAAALTFVNALSSVPIALGAGKVFGDRSEITHLAGGLGITLAAILTTWLWWRASGRAPGRGVFSG